ncbi:methionine aminopeptidase 2B-like isoform X2 [Camellia sinensis]|uniref:methionine aminopeptidase 2B-like isoform X2 n=1 Tax=Camellia sinensis TaxID=4442 RepID=UPI00103638C3|nr:methionine aminopeptidase 2B-like isoform X2 [Camellia sinensis]
MDLVRKYIKGILKPEVLMFDLYVQPWRIFRIVCKQALHSPQDALWIGRIVDYAFTVAFNPMFRHLLEASQEATNIGILVLLKILKAGMILFWCIMHSSSTHVNYSYFLKCNLWLNYK